MPDEYLVVFNRFGDTYHAPERDENGPYALRQMRFRVACGAELEEGWASAFAQAPDEVLGDASACPVCFPRQ